MGCGVIARHKVPTLILVDRTPLVDQWKERLREHLGLGPKDIGQLGGGKKTKLTGRIDLATSHSPGQLTQQRSFLSTAWSS